MKRGTARDAGINRRGRQARFGRVMHVNLERGRSACRLRRQIRLHGRDALAIQRLPRLDHFLRIGLVVNHILRRLQIQDGIRARPAAGDVGQPFESARCQLGRAWLEIIVPDRLIQHMTVLHLRGHRRVDFLTRHGVVALG